MKLARFEIASELLKQILCLPDDCQIVGVDNEHAPREYGITVSSNEFPEIAEDALPTQCSPTFKSINNHSVQFEKWNFQGEVTNAKID